MKGIVPITIAAIAFSFYPLFNSLALQTTSPFLLALLIQISTIFVGVCMLAIINGSFRKICAYFVEYNALPFETKIVPILSGVGIYLGGVFFLFALSLMSKAGASLIMESWPILALIITPVVLHKNWQKIGLIDYVLIFISLIGLVCITASEENIPFENFIKNPFFIFKTQDFYGYIGVIVALLSALCFAASSIARAYFSKTLPNKFRIKHFKKVDSIEESVFTYLLTYLFGLPLALISFIFLEDTVNFEIQAITPIIFVGFALVITSSLYSYALLITDNTNINLLWYTSPLLAAIWLSLFGFSQITPMLIFGGALIIAANIILILKSRKPRLNV